MAYCYKNILIIERKNISNIDFIDNLFNKFNLSFDNNIPFEYKNQEDKFLFYFNSNFYDNDEFNIVNVIMIENVVGYIKCIVDINNIKFERMSFESNESFKNNLIVTKKYLSKTIRDIENIDNFHKTKYTLYWNNNVINTQNLFNIIKEVELINNKDNTYTFVLNDVYPSYVTPLTFNSSTSVTSFKPESTSTTTPPTTTSFSSSTTTPTTTTNSTTSFNSSTITPTTSTSTTTPTTTTNSTTSFNSSTITPTTSTTSFSSSTTTPTTSFKPESTTFSSITPTTTFKPTSSGMFSSSTPMGFKPSSSGVFGSTTSMGFKPASSSIFGSGTPSTGFKPASSGIFSSTKPSTGFTPSNVSTSFFTPSTKFGFNK